MRHTVKNRRWKSGAHCAVTAAVVVVHAVGALSVAYGQNLMSGAEVEWTSPPDGYVYPGPALDALGGPVGLSEFTVHFSAPVELTASMISIAVTGGTAPGVASVAQPDTAVETWEVVLDGPIPAHEATTITFDEYGSVTFWAVPGDVDQDALLTTDDYDALSAASEAGATDPLYHDINGDGDVDIDDHAVLLDLLADGGKLYACCEFEGVCDIYWGSGGCPSGTTPVDCPCPPGGPGNN